jgi:hypothetical protein
MSRNIIRLVAAAGLALVLVVLPGPVRAEDFGARAVQGLVTGGEGKPLEGVTVTLENLTTSALRSYITQADGRYIFHRVPDFQDHRLTARYQGRSGETKILSRFDARDPAIVNLKVPVAR